MGIYISVYIRFVTGKAIIAEAGCNGSSLQTSLLMGYNTKFHLPSDPNPNMRDSGIILCSNAPEISFCSVVYEIFLECDDDDDDDEDNDGDHVDD